MTATTAVAYTLAAGLVAFGLLSGWYQFRGRAALHDRTHVPSDELAYLRGRYRRRLVTGVLLAVIGGLIAGAFLSGLEPQVDAPIASAEANDADPPPELTPEQKSLVKVWGGYWSVVVVLVLVVFGFAFADAMSTRRYALQQYRIIREDHEAKLRRDLAVYKAQQDSRRNGRGSGELPSDDDKDADAD